MVNNALGNLHKFHQSRTHYRSGKTYLALVGAGNHRYVSVYSHKRNEWSSHERVGTKLISPKDHHGNPSILIDREGFLHVFYEGIIKRCTTVDLQNRWVMVIGRTIRRAFLIVRVLILSFSWCPTVPFTVFTPRKTHIGNWSYATSKGNGRTWSKEVHVLDAVLVIVDKVNEQRVPVKLRLWVWGGSGFLE